MQQESLAMVKRSFPVLGKLWVFQSRCGNQGKGKKKSLFPESATVVTTTAQGGGKKKCFPNALGYTLVVLEVL